MNKDKLKSGDQGIITYKSSNPFEFFHILNSKEQDEQDMFGTLIFPEKKKKSYPLVICMHGSLGWRGHHHEHAVNFLNNGFAIFRVSSFDARQVISIVEDQMQVTLATVMTDCFNSLKILSKHPDIDAKNIFIAGWSLGGSTALYSAWKPLAEKLAPEGERFAGHIAFYPGAFIWPEEMRNHLNPDVTVRSRGIMEKCSFCIQRVRRGARKAKEENRELKDGEITTACQDACSTQAITFGDLNDPESKVSKLSKDDRSYTLMPQFNTDPNVIYLASIKVNKEESQEEKAQSHD